MLDDDCFQSKHVVLKKEHWNVVLGGIVSICVINYTQQNGYYLIKFLYVTEMNTVLQSVKLCYSISFLRSHIPYTVNACPCEE